MEGTQRHVWHHTAWTDDGSGAGGGEGGRPVTYIAIEGLWFVPVPSKQDRNPAGWWHVAAITGIGASRLRPSEGEDKNKVLDDIVDRLEYARVDAARITPPVLDAGLDGWRRWIVGTRYAVTGGQLKPYCFVGRTSDLADRAMHLMADVLGPGRGLYRVAQPEGWRIAVVTKDVTSSGDGLADRVRLTVARDKDVTSALLRRCVNFCREGFPPKQVAVPAAVAGELKSMAPMWLPELVGVARLPMLDPETCDYRPTGYDPSSRKFVDPDFTPSSVLTGPSSVSHSLHEALWAFSDFPLVDGWGPLLALLLEPVVRPLARAVRPLWVIDAPTGGQGTGKTLLARSVAALAEGRDPGVMVLPSSDSELEKRITAVVRSAKEVHIFDNVTGTVRSPALAALSTSTTWEGRTLGVSEAPSLPLVTTWVFTSNQAQLNRDLARRCVFLRLDAGGAARDRAGFKVRNLVEYCVTRRAWVMSHLAELVRAWLVAGAPGPHPSMARLASYEDWLRVTGGVLSWVDSVLPGMGLVSGFSTALQVQQTRDVDAQDEDAFVRAWADTYGARGVLLTQLVALAEDAGLFADFFTGPGAGRPGPWRTRRFGAEILPRVLGLRVGRLTAVGPIADTKGRMRAYALKLGGIEDEQGTETNGTNDTNDTNDGLDRRP